MSNVYASIVCHLRSDPFRKTQNCVDFFYFTTYSDTSEYRFYFAQCLNVTEVPGFTAIWVFSHKLKDFSKSKNHIRMGILVLKDHYYVSLTSVGKLLNKIVRIPNGRENAEYISFLQLSI